MNTDSLSALLDGECHGSELDALLDEMDRNPQLALEWSRMCKARDLRLGSVVSADWGCICTEVMSKLDDQPSFNSDKVVGIAGKRTAVADRIKRFWKPVAGFAAAASMGAAAVLLVQPQVANTEFQIAPDVVADLQPLQWAQVSEVASAEPQDDSHSEMLREYLMDHNNAVAGEGVGGTLRYARFAAHTAEYRPYAGERP